MTGERLLIKSLGDLYYHLCTNLFIASSKLQHFWWVSGPRVSNQTSFTCTAFQPPVTQFSCVHIQGSCLTLSCDHLQAPLKQGSWLPTISSWTFLLLQRWQREAEVTKKKKEAKILFHSSWIIDSAVVQRTEDIHCSYHIKLKAF